MSPAASLTEYLDTIPQGRLGIIAMRGCEELAKKVSDQIVECRDKYEKEHSNLHLKGYHRDSYILDATFPRFSTGEVRVLSMNQSEATIFSSSVTASTTALLTKCITLRMLTAIPFRFL